MAEGKGDESATVFYEWTSRAHYAQGIALILIVPILFLPAWYFRIAFLVWLVLLLSWTEFFRFEVDEEREEIRVTTLWLKWKERKKVVYPFSAVRSVRIEDGGEGKDWCVLEMEDGKQYWLDEKRCSLLQKLLKRTT